ncbi:hypothetical protein DOFOFD_07415 [Acetobacteraceae bacterium EV16P]|uniref:Uncharacterized protein n=1 Tax=Sorlinia euscelidii TaxID=3081148 RepID=A0ABU7U1V8_9PROT
MVVFTKVEIVSNCAFRSSTDIVLPPIAVSKAVRRSPENLEKFAPATVPSSLNFPTEMPRSSTTLAMSLSCVMVRI